MAPTKPHSRIYMRGLYDGFRIGIQKEMTPSKFKLTLKEQTTIAQKVFEFIPADAPASAQFISSRIIAAATMRVEMKTLEGVLDSLKDAGLVKEQPRGQFIRVVPREPITVPGQKPEPTLSSADLDDVDTAAVTTQSTVQTDAKSVPAIDAFGELATSLRLKAQNLLRLADEIDATALRYADEQESAEKRYSKVRELAGLLRDIA